MSTLSDTVRMSHREDPHTSKEAAAKVTTKKEALYRVVLFLLEHHGPLTPYEVLERYRVAGFESLHGHDVDLYDLRRRMTELDKDLHRIEPIQVGTHKDGSPQYMTRAGQRVMRLVEETNK